MSAPCRLTPAVSESNAVSPPLGASVGQTHSLDLARRAQQVRVHLWGTARQFGVHGEGVGRSQGLEQMRRPVARLFARAVGGQGLDVGGAGLETLLRPVPLHLGYQGVPLALGHAAELHR